MPVQPGVLPFDLANLLSDGQGAGLAVLERDMAEPDAYGGTQKPNWQPLSTVECVLVWNKSTGTRSANRTYVSPDRRVPVSESFMIVPAGTDVTENDRVAQILDVDGAGTVEGQFTITAVLNQETHIEVYMERMVLGP